MENKPNGESFSRSQSRGIHRRQHSQKLPVRPAGVLVLHMEFADDALVDEDGDGESEEADDGEAAAGPAEVELEVLAACVPLLDPLVLVHLHAAPHLLRSLSSIRRRRRRLLSPAARMRWWAREKGQRPDADLVWGDRKSVV